MTFLSFSRVALSRATRQLFFFMASLLFVLAASATHAADEAATFSNEELDQMLAPIALYPDSLLAQVLMAATYPADVVEAAKWSEANPEQQGDAAVRRWLDKSWDPSVKVAGGFSAGTCHDERQAR